MMRMPDTSSCMMLLMRSSCACSFSKRGLALLKHSVMQPSMKGSAHSTTQPKRASSRNMNTMLPTVSSVVRIMPRTNCAMKFCTCVTSLVTRVTREPVV